MRQMIEISLPILFDLMLVWRSVQITDQSAG